jgi:hypothetical protein
VFAIDTSKRALSSGVTRAAIDAIRSLLHRVSLPGGSDARVGIVTFDKQIQFYSVRPTAHEPISLFVVGT